MTRRWAAAALAIGLAAAPARAGAECTSEHECAFVRGNALFDRGQWAAARAEYLSAYAADPRPIALFNVASTYRHEGDRVNERRYYQRYLEVAGDDAQWSALARERITELDAALAAAPVRAAPYPRAAIARPLALPPGVTTLDLGFEVVPRGEGATAAGATSTSYAALTWLGATRGIAPRLQVGGELALDAGSARRSAAFAEAAVALADGAVAVAVRGALGLSFSGPSLHDARLAAPVRWRLGGRLALVSDGDHLVIALAEQGRAAFLRAPIGVAYQLTGAIYVTAGTRLVDVDLTAPRAGGLLAGDRFAQIGVVASPVESLDLAARLELVPDGAVGTVFARWRR